MWVPASVSEGSSAHSTCSSVTSPFDQVTSTVAGSSGAVPEGVETVCGAATDSTVAGSTTTSAVTGPETPPTDPETSNEPPSRAA